MKLLEQNILNYSDLPTMPLPNEYTRYGVIIDTDGWPRHATRQHYCAVVQAQSTMKGARYYIKVIEGENNAWLNVKADRVKYFERLEDAEKYAAQLKKMTPLK